MALELELCALYFFWQPNTYSKWLGYVSHMLLSAAISSSLVNGIQPKNFVLFSIGKLNLLLHEAPKNDVSCIFLVKYLMKKLRKFKIISVVSHKATCRVKTPENLRSWVKKQQMFSKLSRSFTFFLSFLSLFFSFFIGSNFNNPYIFITNTPKIRFLGILVFQFCYINK